MNRNSIITGSSHHKHITDNKDSIYSAINYLYYIFFFLL